MSNFGYDKITNNIHVNNASISMLAMEVILGLQKSSIAKNAYL